MGTNMSSANMTGGKAHLTSAVVKRFLQLGTLILVQAAILLGVSGRLDWVGAWLYLGVYVGEILVNSLLLLPRHAEVVAERSQVGANAKGWDRTLTRLMAVIALTILIVAGLDARNGWTAALSGGIQIGGVALIIVSWALLSWAMATNMYFSTVVRIQEERGHHAITTGPYRFIRHPGYVGIIISCIATPLLLSSLWALIPAGLTILLYVIRTALEDKTLLAELPGYEDYAHRVRYRLLPGIW